jgi:phage terminase large subunit GpA-like protein
MSGLYRLIGLKDSFTSYLHEFAATFLDRKRAGRMALRAWVNTFLAETYEEDAEATVNPKAVLDRCEFYLPRELPVAALVVTAGVDVQKNRIEAELIAYGADEERWGIEKRVIWGDTEKDETWDKLDEFLLLAAKRADGVELKVERAFIDMNYKPDRVLAFCRPRLGRGVYPCIGINRVGNLVPPLLPPKPSRNNKARLPHWPVGVTVAKSIIYDRLLLPVPGARSMHFPHGYGYDEEHFKQLTVEIRRTRYSHGQAYSIFEKPNDSVRNEALDLAVYGLAALHSLFPINWSKLAENREGQRAELEPATVAAEDTPTPGFDQNPPADQQPPPARPRTAPRRSWMSGGW